MLEFKTCELTDEEPDNKGSQEDERKPLAVTPYVSSVSERIRKACEKFDLRVVFKSGPTLRSLLTKVKDPLPKEKPAGVVYQIPCQCGKVYVGETQRRLETRVRASGCMQQGGHVEVCHSRAPVEPATPSGLGRNQSAGQGHQTCPAKGKGSLTH